MAEHLSNYWKKRAPHKPMEYVDDRIVIRPMHDLPLVEKQYIYEGQIVPNRIIKDRNVYEITRLDPQYYINGFMVITQQALVQVVTLFGFHPNRDPDTFLYCIPDYKKGVLFDQIYFERLLTNIKTWYLDNCFFLPSKKRYTTKKLKSIAIQLNEGE
jgi:hypothetical protein